MYEIQTDEFQPENFHAGGFPIIPKSGATNEDILKYSLVAQGRGESIVNVTTENLDNICGIAAADSSNGKVVYYQTGEFFGNSIVLPEGVTLDQVIPICRKLSIFLK